MAAAAWTRTWLEWHGCWPERPVLTMNDEHRWMTGVYRDFGYPGAAGSRRNLAAAQADSSSRAPNRSEEHTSEIQSLTNIVCRLLVEKKKKITSMQTRHVNSWIAYH